ncbi:MAG: MaoC family dehydratase [Alphaproteobacteria bacterium]|nr:MaoC family dehydratase [Alphaproteobacteria bacterium]
MPLLHFEDFAPGQTFALENRHTVTKDEIIAFARAYDRQAHHLDEEAAAQTIVGGLCASGWQVCAFAMRLMVDGFLANTTAQGATGVEECRWLKPVRPGDVLRVEAEVLAVSVPQSLPGVGFVKLRWDLFNQDGLVTQMVSAPILRRRT